MRQVYVVDGSVDSLLITGAEVPLGVYSPTDVLSLYQRLLPNEYFDELRRVGTLCENNRVYNARTVMWMMTRQRMEGGTMSSSLLELIRGLPTDFWPLPCKRLRPGPDGQKRNLSQNTASFNEAQRSLKRSVVEKGYDHSLTGLLAQAKEKEPEAGGVFILDGSTTRTAHTEELCRLYPPGKNQHGESHWPVMRVLVAHDAYTGLAMRPQWGAFYGPEAVSEQALLIQALDRLPNGATLLADTNFGVFYVAHAATQKGHPVLLRMQPMRAKRLLGGAWQDGLDQRIEWRPSLEERKKYNFPEDACVVGRLIVRQVQPNNGKPAFLLGVFTTLPGSPEELLSLYGRRWEIETDLRTLKSSLQLGQLTCTSSEMVAKELIMGMFAYNLVRMVTFLAAQTTGLPPRAFSFTQVRNVINAFAPLIAAARDPREAEQQLQRMMYYVNRALLPKRRQRPSQPRAAWGKPSTYPKRKGITDAKDSI